MHETSAGAYWFPPTQLGGGSIVVNILEGTNNRADFNNVGGCCAVNFLHGTLDVKIASCGLHGSAVNGAPAIEGRYSLP